MLKTIVVVVVLACAAVAFADSQVTVRGKISTGEDGGGIKSYDGKYYEFLSITDQNIEGKVNNICKESDDCEITGIINRENSFISVSEVRKIKPGSGVAYNNQSASSVNAFRFAESDFVESKIKRRFTKNIVGNVVFADISGIAVTAILTSDNEIFVISRRDDPTLKVFEVAAFRGSKMACNSTWAEFENNVKIADGQTVFQEILSNQQTEKSTVQNQQVKEWHRFETFGYQDMSTGTWWVPDRQRGSGYKAQPYPPSGVRPTNFTIVRCAGYPWENGH